MEAPHDYDEKCPHCRPAILDTKTGTALKADHPLVVLVNKVFDEASYKHRRAFIRVTNSKFFSNGVTEKDQTLHAELAGRMQQAIAKHEIGSN